jgi:hypothetical protein
MALEFMDILRDRGAWLGFVGGGHLRRSRYWDIMRQACL